MLSIDREQFAAGVRWWQTKTSWPNDFHNSDYEMLAAQSPDGDFGTAGGRASCSG
ncbi:hypothetical protein [Micromonospora sp. NPDC047740]|uniref:hypothetical protein n=1 Tax=Micromonospora sp. NPDC047740 TaxID=3364254 RepID=UPI00371961DB